MSAWGLHNTLMQFDKIFNIEIIIFSTKGHLILNRFDQKTNEIFFKDLCPSTVVFQPTLIQNHFFF